MDFNYVIPGTLCEFSAHSVVKKMKHRKHDENKERLKENRMKM